MPELHREARAGVNLASEVELLSYLHAGATPIEAVARLDLGDSSGPLSGAGGPYAAGVYLDGVPVLPALQATVPPGRARLVFVSGCVAVGPGETVSLRAQGLAGDTAVNTAASLRDVTAIKVADVTGAGTVVVDHDYGSPDALRATGAGGAGVADVTINAYTGADYAAGRRSADFIVGRTDTLADGRWARPLILDPGAYTLVYYKSGQFGPNVVDLAVA